MSDMFIPKKEKLKIIIEAVVYVALVIAASYFTIFGDIFIRMVPLIYFLGIFGNIMFNRSIVTVVLTSISVLVFGYMVEGSINTNTLLFALYSAFMIGFGAVTGYILNALYENFKLRKFIKYYTKITYVILLAIVILIPLFMNNLVNGNMITYLIGKNRVDKYVRENYAYTNYYIANVSFLPSYAAGTYEFNTVIDGINVKLNYTLANEISDTNMIERKETLDKMLNAKLNILLKQNNLQALNVTGKYEYSKIATIPDSIYISITDVTESKLDSLLKCINALKTWEDFEKISRINIEINGKAMTITKSDLSKKDMTKEYILNGIKYEMLDSKEGI